MERFEAELVAGMRAPCTTWTSVVVPPAVVERWGRARIAVRGTIDGAPFRGTVARVGGVHRMPVKQGLLARIGASRGERVEAAMDHAQGSLARP